MATSAGSPWTHRVSSSSVIRRRSWRSVVRDSPVVVKRSAPAVSSPRAIRRSTSIEIQKADRGEDIARFRRYLAENYYTPPPPKTPGTSQDPPEDREGSVPARDPEALTRATPGEGSWAVREDSPSIYSGASQDANAPLLPILTIYILGFPLTNLRGYSGINVRRDYYDAVSGEKIQARDAFIEHLTHDSHVIQVSELKHRRRNKLERLLSFFEQMHLQANGHLKLFAEELDEEFHIIQDRLSRAALDKAIRDEMDVEDEFMELLKRKERSHAEILEATRIELEEARAREEEERRLKEEARRQKEEALAELAELKRHMEKTNK